MGIVRILPRQIDQAGAAAGDALLWNAGTKWTPTTLTSANISGFTESVQDVVGGLVLDSTTIDFTYDDNANTLTAAAITQMTVTSDGSGIKLVNDDATPGSNKIYGTDGAGTKGWFTAPSGADGNGIYSGSGTIALGAQATVTTNSFFNIKFAGSGTAININSTTGSESIRLEAKGAGNGGLFLDSTTAVLYAGGSNLGITIDDENTRLDSFYNIISSDVQFDSVTTPANINSIENDYAPGGRYSSLRLTPSLANCTITGIVHGRTLGNAINAQGRILNIINIHGSNTITIAAEDAGSQAEYRFVDGLVINPGRMASFMYDGDTQRWRTSGVGGVTGILTASNGLTASAGNVKLGGTLTEVTTITGDTTNFLTVTGNRTAFDAASLVVNNTGTSGPALKANATGSGAGVYGTTTTGTAVYGAATTGLGLGAYTTGNTMALFTAETTAINTVVSALVLDHLTTGTAGNGIGSKILFRNETSTLPSVEANSIVSKWSNAIGGSQLAEFSITGYNITTENTLLTLSGTGAARLNQYGGAGFTGLATKTLQVDSSGNIIQGSAVPSVPLNLIIAATGDSGVNHGASAISWDWNSATTGTSMKFATNSLSTGTLFEVSTTSAALNSTNGLFRVLNTSASQVGKLAEFKANSGAESGMTWLTNGKVGIGKAAPTVALHVVGGDGIRSESGIFHAKSTGDDFTTLATAAALRLENTTAINGRTWYLGSRDDGNLRIGNQDNAYVDIQKSTGMFVPFNSFALPGVTSGLSITANTNDWNPNPNQDTTVWLVSATGAFNITGINDSYQGRIIYLVNTGANAITLKKDDANSSPENRIMMRVDQLMAQDSTVQLWYDNTITKWRVISSQ